MKITFSSAVNKTQAFLPSDPASQVYILRSRNIWVRGGRQGPAVLQPHKMLFKRQNERKLQEQPKPFAKRTPLWNDGKIWNRGFPGAGSVTGHRIIGPNSTA